IQVVFPKGGSRLLTVLFLIRRSTMKFLSPCRRIAQIALVLLLCLSVVGCGSKITKENAGKIKKGMTEKEMTDILGKPESKEIMGKKTLVWEKGDTVVSVIVDKDGKSLGEAMFIEDKTKVK